MHNNIMAAGSKERPPMLGPGRYSQWHSRFLRYLDTKTNGEYLRKCIFDGPYMPTNVLIAAVEAAENILPVAAHEEAETIHNMTAENRLYFLAEKEAIFLILTGIGDEIYSTVDACNTAKEMWTAIERLQQGESLNVQDVKTNLFWEFGKFTSRDGESMESYYSRFYKLMNELTRNNLQVSPMQVNVQFLQQLQPEWSRFVTVVKQGQEIDTVSYHKLFDVLKQFQNEVNDIRSERLARSANPLALLAAAQPYSDNYYQAPKPQRSNAPSYMQSSSTRPSASTRHKGKEIAKPVTPQSESVSEEDSDPEQARRDKDMQKNLALLAKYFKKLYKPTNNNLRTSSNSTNKTEDTTPRYNNDNQSGQFGNQRTMTVAGARETVGSPVVQQNGIQCFNCKGFGHYARECRKPKRVKDYAYHKEKMMMCKQAEQGVPLQAEQADWLEEREKIDKVHITSSRSANPLALLAAAQPYSDNYYQAPKPQRSNAPSYMQSSSTRPSASTRHKGKEIAKPVTPQSESVSKEDSDPEQARRDKDMKKNLALLAKYFKNLYNLPTTTFELLQTLGTRMKILHQVGSPIVQQNRIQCFNCKGFGHYTKECRKPKRVKDYAYHKEKMMMCKQAEQGVPLQAEQADWLEDTDEEIDEQELEAHYSYMAKIQEVSPEETSSTSQPLEQVQNHDENDVFANMRRHSEQPESINDTYVLEKDDSNVIPDSSNICTNDNQVDQNAAECVDERAALANLIANLTLDTEENKTVLKQLKKANASLTQELKECKTNLDESSRALGEATSSRDSSLIALQTKQTELEKYTALNDLTSDYKILQTKLNETLGLLALKDIDIKEGLKTKTYEISVVNQKHDELVKKSLLTRSQFEGQLKEKSKVISDLKVKEGKDIDTMIEMDKQIKFLNEILYKRNQSIQTIHMLAPKCATYHGRSTFANPKYLKKAQSDKPRLYEIPYDTSDPANRFCPDGEETVTLEKESRSKLDKDTVKPYNYTYQNSLYETFKPPSKAYLDQLERAKEVRKTMWRKTSQRNMGPGRVTS
ncbi:retrovirus-related pol polyprotein from transposon TNT 1-94 [Tanacetum coccineum]|uniref:Retrovirus-related pol polyprotein from transposon TNT 1-94 n=1 Tax=Tanacetum coccineum TaxID=301880 RepID=A0ABQ5GIY1_9ASTR